MCRVIEADKDACTSPSSEKKRETTMDFAANIEKVREVRDREIFYSIESVIGNIRKISSCALCYIFSAAGIGAHSPPKRPKRFSPTSPTAALSYATAQISTTSSR